MRIPYLVAQAKSPLPSLGGSLLRARPVLAVRIAGPARSLLLDGLLDTGSDDTVFEEWVAATIGVDLSQAAERQVGLVGRTSLVRCRYAPVELRITDGIRETYQWTTLVVLFRRTCGIRCSVTPVVCNSSMPTFAVRIGKLS